MHTVSCSNKGTLSFLCLLPLFALGCANENLPSSQELGPLRVLGLIADKPEANEGDTVQVIPIISDFSAASTSGPRTLAYSWKFCADPGVALGVTPSCSGTLIGSGSGSITVSEAPLTTLPFSGKASSDPINLTIPAGVLAAISPEQASNGVPLVFTFELSAGSEVTRAFRRIIVTTRTGAQLNTPVSLTSLSGLTSGSPSTFPTTEAKLTPVLASSAETYTVISTTGENLTRTEKLTVSWFTTAGEFEFSRTDGSSPNTWTPPESGTALGLIILRDDRGGVSDPITIGY
jgi:hypothetical protein